MKQLNLVVLIIFCFLFYGGNLQDLSAKKFKFKYNTGNSGKIKVLKSFTTRESNANKARPTKEYCMGSKIHFYYKIGPVKCIKGKGIPFKTRMVVNVFSETGEKKQDLGWHDGNGVAKNQMNKTQMFGYYHSARWNLMVSSKYAPGTTYEVLIYHKDLNSGKTIKIPYKFYSAACQ